VLNPLARGCHALLREGARLVEGLDDLLEELPPVRPGAVLPAPSSAQPVVDDPRDRALLRELRAARATSPLSTILATAHCCASCAPGRHRSMRWSRRPRLVPVRSPRGCWPWNSAAM
jgi:hypothetical protein